MTPRITISKNGNGELEIWLNGAGRDLLVNELNRLNEDNDHFHFSSSPTDPAITIRTKAYNKGDEVFGWGKVLFRLDEWDRKFFPQVMDESRAS